MTFILDDTIIQVLHNDMISHNPYLVRITTYNQCAEFRINSDDLLELSKYLYQIVKRNEDA